VKRRMLALLMVLGLVAAACSSTTTETTTTTTAEAVEDETPATAPATIAASDQMSTGDSVIIESVDLPAPGFVAVHGDNNGAPGGIIGVSDLLPAGSSTNVTVVFDAMIDGTATVYPMVHIDGDGNGAYTSDDGPGFGAGGDVAVTAVVLDIAPATAPSSLGADDQTTDGLGIVIATVTLPSPGFVAVHGDADGGPGPVIGHSALLPAGTSTDVEVMFDAPVDASTALYPMVHIDLDGDGEYTFQPPDNAIDLPGLTDSGDVAVTKITLTVTPQRAPSALEASDQDSDGTSIVIASVSLPAAGFVAIHSDADGAPGPVIGVSDILPAGESTDVVVNLMEALSGSATVWPMVHIDLDGDGVYTFQPPDNAIDLPGLTADGNVAVTSILIGM
jgi:S-layer glycoprotein